MNWTKRKGGGIWYHLELPFGIVLSIGGDKKHGYKTYGKHPDIIPNAVRTLKEAKKIVERLVEEQWKKINP